MSKPVLTLSDGLPRVGVALPSISHDGQFIYVVFTDTNENISQFFQNVNGKLFPGNALAKDNAFPDTQSGFANNKFTRFSLLDADDPNGLGRIRIFDQSYNQIAQRTFNDVIGNAVFLGGKFSPDDRYVALTYIYQNSPQRSILQVLDAQTLQTVASTTFDTHTNGPEFLEYNCKLYVVVSSGGSVGPGFFGPPAQVTVYRLRHGTLTIVDSQSLPQFPRTTSVLNHSRCSNSDSCDPNIVVGTRAAFLQGEKGLAVDNSTFPSFLPADGAEVRFYRFDGRRLKLVVKQNPNVSIYTTSFSAKHNWVVVSYVDEPVGSETGFLSVYENNKSLNILQSDIPVLPFAFVSQFSKSGKWFVIGGRNRPFADPVFNNVLLYRVHSICNDKPHDKCHDRCRDDSCSCACDY